MKHKQWLSFGLLLFLLGAAPDLGRANDTEQRRVATQFIRHYFLSDLQQLAQTLPSNGLELFGPYPFKGMITLGAAKVDDAQAILEFTADTADPRFRKHGAIMFRRDGTTWLVRQVLFYDRVPRLFGLPAKSVSDRDRAYEPAVKAVGAAFLAAWQKDDARRMRELWYDWTQVPRQPVERLSVSNIDIDLSHTIWSDPYARYTARLTYRLGILSYSMTVKGGLLLVEEKNRWKVRANTLVLDF
jgi:hypothetical protein